ncbi:ribosomal L7Ae/L30e/S12e/Gadd45 family protein [Helicovermis profundi]|uniref:Ribosomal L7Ae/L30e/S12e/Gadd45 family protein n=2 Tax=Helicovermis profundi TaxID=3065157 RepID=A0AAU9EPQ7_9FIRM|nr:ribosomal L7Ae/L30e/S12e/Gadd45 family protein [Clostridia bacterium S502]
MYMLEFEEEKVRVGVKQSLKAILDDKVVKVYIAKDAEQYVTRRVIELANRSSVEIVFINTMKELGNACKIDVGAATAVIIK